LLQIGILNFTSSQAKRQESGLQIRIYAGEKNQLLELIEGTTS